MGLASEFDGIGRVLTQVRDDAGLAQASVARTMGSNPSRVFRIENGEVLPTDEEVESYLRAVDTAMGQDCLDYLSANWADATHRPGYPHPDWRALNTIDQQLARIDVLKGDKETKAVFVRALDLY